MPTTTFKDAFCAAYTIDPVHYERAALFRFLSLRARIAFPLIALFDPYAFHQERRLVEFVGKATSLTDIQDDVDFYQHKYVCNSFFRGTLRMRISGKYLLKVAKQVWLTQQRPTTAAPPPRATRAVG